MKGGEAIIKALIEQGADTVFGYPGGQVLPLYDMIYNSDLNHVLVRHEQSASHAADGFARASGKVGVCIATSGPGATNLVTGIATAYMDSSPVVAITGQVPTHLIGNDAFQEVDMLGIAMPITKHAFQPKNSTNIPAIINSSFEIAKSGRPGPVVIDVPKNVQEQDLDDDIANLDSFSKLSFNTPGYNPTIKGNPRQVKKASKIIAKSSKPIILAGGGVIISGASKELKEFSELIQAPVTTTLLGKGSFPEDNDAYLGMLGMHGRKVANLSLDESDCLIAIGCRFSDRTTGNIADFARNSEVIHIDIDPAEIGKNVEVDVPIVGDAKNILNSLINNIKSLNINKINENSAEWYNDTLMFKKSCIPRVTYNETPLKPQQVIKEISNALDDDSIITTDVGQHQMWAAHFFNTMKPRKFISSGGLGTMGFGFPSAIGAKVAMPENDVLAVTGDGGFLMVCQDLATVKDYDIPLIICLFNNRKLGMVYQWQNLFYENRLSHTDLGQTPDFLKLSESFGVNAERITKVGETEKAIKAAKKDGEAILLDIVIDKDEELPMVPPGCGITDIIGEYKIENDITGISGGLSDTNDVIANKKDGD
ncbi:acetolactate synthase, large subunit [Methanobrevibacter arboriphilus JCM 13429 = DSM 1125]|uniref:Acetolactate synthase n=1 Tax=Methanobrevibacter arboriphilus JCM 13429 = DSM 1125 TaxID=1300164 RepID=A0A1V6N1J0_METAZ|nr:acetolactate synthase large subunit [Methanobrevibacter arboriphilus]OQD58590.1 acetolactate synthase, large subunit [Methanobrevibacter arboriphilus JCM 13429 = DSM 1125]